MISWAVRFIRGQSDAAIAASKEILALAADRDDSYKAEGYWSRCASEWWAGNFAESLAMSTRGLAAYQIEPSRVHAAAFGQNGGPLMTCYVAWAHLVLGRPDEAREWQRRALDLADEVNDKFTRVATRWHAAFLYSLGGWTAESQPLADEVVAISAEESYAFWLALGLGLRGMLLAQNGKPAEGVAVPPRRRRRVRRHRLGHPPHLLPWRAGRGTVARGEPRGARAAWPAAATTTTGSASGRSRANCSARGRVPGRRGGHRRRRGAAGGGTNGSRRRQGATLFERRAACGVGRGADRLICPCAGGAPSRDRSHRPFACLTTSSPR